MPQTVRNPEPKLPKKKTDKDLVIDHLRRPPSLLEEGHISKCESIEFSTSIVSVIASGMTLLRTEERPELNPCRDSCLDSCGVHVCVFFSSWYGT